MKGRSNSYIPAAARSGGFAGIGSRAMSLGHGAVMAAAFAIIVAITHCAPALAQSSGGSRSYLTPFPKNDVYVLHVFGDYFAEGIAFGLADAFKTDRRVRVIKEHRRVSAIVRSNFEKSVAKQTDAKAGKAVHIGVIMIGGNDKASIRAPGRDRLRRGTDEWKSEYARRVDHFIQALKRRKIAVYWVGLPIMRQQKDNEFAKMITGIIRERAYLNGVRFIDAYDGFVDENGEYDKDGPDVKGTFRRLRDPDGHTFTWAGNRKLAHFVKREIKRDLVLAKVERAVPLAGSKAEQSRINAKRRTAAAATKAGWSGTVKSAARGKRGGSKQGRARAAPSGPAGQKADNTRIRLKSIGADGKAKTVTVDILRPAIPAAVIELITRKMSPDRPARLGTDIPGILKGGLTVLSSITPAGNRSGSRRARNLPPTHAPFYRVLIKGEPLTPKPGRADDFTWPRAGTSQARAPGAQRPRASRPSAGGLPRG